MPLETTVTGSPREVSSSVDVSSLVGSGFPSPQLVRSAAGLFDRLPAWDGCEGPRRRITVSAGALRIGRHDPARAERTAERLEHHKRQGRSVSARERDVNGTRVRGSEVVGGSIALAAEQLLNTWAAEVVAEGLGLDVLPLNRVLPMGQTESLGPQLAKWVARRRIAVWSRRSRSRMRYTMASLDWSGFFDQGAAAMLTLTYPGDWRTVAPDAGACKRHVDALRKRFARAYGRPLVGVWKREFQRRGAPHYHVFMVPPVERVDGLTFRQWVSEAWADIVGHPDPEERRRHVQAGTGIDYREGVRAKDPRRLAAYFAKHGLYAAKDYQNEAPAEWLVGPQGVGRFWGVWGLDKAVAVVEVEDQDGDNAARIMRRWSRANGFRAQRTVWRTDTRTGAQRPRRSGGWVSFMPGSNGFLIVNDGPAFASALSRALPIMRS